MGMDVYGKKPKTEKGEYFRSNIWYWRPLWMYCEHISPELTNKVQYAQSNDGDGLGSIDSRKLGFLLRKSLQNGTAEQYVKDYYKNLEDLPLENCYCTDSSNTMFMSYSPQGEIPFPKNFSPKPSCTICSGSGYMKNTFTMYHMDIDLISSFSDFLLDCGGFEIW